MLTNMPAPIPKGPMREPLVAAVDYETFYDTKAKYSLTSMTPDAYCRDRRFRAYLVAVAFSDGRWYVGDPEDFGWASLDGVPLLAHNAAFDGRVTTELERRGIIPASPRRWFDTADLAAYLGVRRSLKDAMMDLYGEDISKAVRSGMDGRLPSALTPSEYADLVRYGASDAEECLRIWKDFSHLWPDAEREVSRMNRESGWYGVRVDLDAVEKGLRTLEKMNARAAENLPWVTAENPADRKAAGSIPALAAEVRKLGIEPPKSFNKKDPGFIDWCAEYADKVPCVRARVDYAGTLPHIARLKRLLSQTDPEGIVRPSFFYFGAHTGRMSAGRGDRSSENINMLNLPKHPVYGVDLRGMYVPREGHKFVVYDYSQVEARGVLWLAGATRTLETIKTEGNLYQAMAVAMGMWPAGSGRKMNKEDPDRYALVKACTLGCGYAISPHKFMMSCRSGGMRLPSVPRDEWPEPDARDLFVLANKYGMSVRDLEEGRLDGEWGEYLTAKKFVGLYRDSNPEVPVLWKTLQNTLEKAALRQDSVFYFELPSGRGKPYWHPYRKDELVAETDPLTGKKSTRRKRSLFASVTYNESPKRPLSGGGITENIVQATFRDAMILSALEIERTVPGCRYLWNCYDEIVFEVPEDLVDEANRRVPELMCSGPHLEWAAGMPFEVEGGIFDRYTK